MSAPSDWIQNNPLLARAAAWPKPVLLGAGAALVAVFVVASLWLQSPDYKPLFSNVEPRDGGAIVSVLNQRNIPYEFQNNGSTILVPADQVYTLRLELAEQGLPRGGNIGFELLDKPKFGASQFTEQITYQRALEGELARSVEALHPVQSARVHLALPRQSLFVREREAPTASVLVTLYPGRSLSKAQVGAIERLVAASVPKMHADSVSVVDQDGHLLSVPEGQAGTNDTRREFRTAIEQRTLQRIVSLLSPIVGAGNVRAEVNADIDFSQREQTSESYQPNERPGTAAIRSKQTSTSAKTGVLPPEGVPGALSNEPPADATTALQSTPAGTPPATAQDQGAPGDAARAASDADESAASAGRPAVPESRHDEATVNYELDHTIQHVKHSPGDIRRLSVAVVVSYRDDHGQLVPPDSEPMRNVQALVRQAMGYSEDRGDSLSVINSAFNHSENTLRVWENPRYQAMAWEFGKVLLMLIGLLFVWRAIVRPIVKSFTDAHTAQINREKSASQTQTQARAALERMRQDEASRASQANRYDDNLNTARELASRDPRAVAMVLRAWMEDNKHANS